MKVTEMNTADGGAIFSLHFADDNEKEIYESALCVLGKKVAQENFTKLMQESIDSGKKLAPMQVPNKQKIMEIGFSKMLTDAVEEAKSDAESYKFKMQKSLKMMAEKGNLQIPKKFSNILKSDGFYQNF